ncbi:MAG: 4-(cytidine 5'-diphospho)-2-C-methyl-D-erythritol kinase [Proteobacteria bacterium]|nr:4-(cytidine 5'-diphospho)-2-C-methyl-D-erythritol kinase [Pseudomonadota bacterium]
MTAADPARGTILRLDAPAKINLYLHVVGKRSDGLHLLDSLVAFAGVGDKLEVREADELTLTVSGRFADALAAPEAGENLVLRAARLLAAEAGVAAAAAIRLDKALPVAAGLGGGSSDAAAALRALADLWRLRPGNDDLVRLGLRLGADVPACLAARAAFVGGIGEDLDPAPRLPPAHLVLLNHGAPLATARVFRALERRWSRPARFAEAPADAAALAEVLAARGNDLETPARRLAPAVGEAHAALAAEPGCLLARMSGSGATCFGIFAAAAEAKTAAQRLARRQPASWVAAAPLLNRFA